MPPPLSNLESNLRILHLVHQFPPDFLGGTEIYTQTVARAQVMTGAHTAVFAPTPREETDDFGPPRAEHEEGVGIYRVAVGSRTPTKIFLQNFRQQRLLESWRAVLAAEQPDIVHVEHLMGMPFALVKELQERAIPYVVTLHDYWYLCANAQLLTNTDSTICEGPDAGAMNCGRCALARAGRSSNIGLEHIVAPVLERRNGQALSVLQRAARLIAPTQFVRDLYRSMGIAASKVTVLPHGTDLPPEAIASIADPADSRASDGRLHIGYIGSIAPQKGLHVLIDAVNSLPQDDVSLTVYGSLDTFPAYVSQLRELITRPGIELAGVVDRRNIWAAIAGFDVVAVPSLWYETSVLVIDEVFALGVPVIGSDIGVLREKIVDGETGRLFVPGDAESLRQIIRSLVADPEVVAEWRRQIRPVFTLGEHIRGLEEIYASAINKI